ncbi:MAG: GTP 3',8-cyclase MoaA [Halorhodospira sp.]
MEGQASAPLVDPCGRPVTYLRLSVTDRCDLRCIYCVSERVTFAPRAHILSLEELELVARAFVRLGVRKIRITGGEPLVRRGVLGLLERLGGVPGLEELVMTTNGAQLARSAQRLSEAGVSRVNISLDTLRPERFRRIAGAARLGRVLAGIEAAREAGFERVRINCLAMRGRNEDEIPRLVGYAVERGLDIAFIEEMPLGGLDRHDRAQAYMAADEVRARIEARYPLMAVAPRPEAGPAQEYQVAGTATRVGFITPHSSSFCDTCNRVRVTAEGMLLPCLGHERGSDLRAVLRGSSGGCQGQLEEAICSGIRHKPAGHGLDAQALARPQLLRFMSATGG